MLRDLFPPRLAFSLAIAIASLHAQNALITHENEYLHSANISLLGQSGGVGRITPNVLKQLSRMPLAFERRDDSGFVARGHGHTVDFLSGGRARISLQTPKVSRNISMEFVGARSASEVAENDLPGITNYIIGSDPRTWRLGVRTYKRITYRGIYPGIDVVYYGNQDRLEFDLLLSPGSDPKSIRLKFRGTDKLQVDKNGGLILAQGLRLDLPKVFQRENSIKGHYRVLGNDEVAFELGPYDQTESLTIDPVLVYSTRFGGGNGYSTSYSVARDLAGNAYVVGVTSSSDFPVVNAAYGGYQSNLDGFVAKLNPAGTEFMYTTYLGGSNSDTLRGIAVDSTGAAWVVGYTTSNDFPLLRAYQDSNRGGQDAVIIKLNPNGSMAYSTYLGGPFTDGAYSVAVDPFDNAFATGEANSEFPTTVDVYQPISPGDTDAFVVKFTSDAALLWSTLVGGTSFDIPSGIAVDRFGNSYIAGVTYSPSFPGSPAGSAQATPSGLPDAFIAKLNYNASGLLYFTFLGGASFDRASAISVDPTSGVAVIAGQTASFDLPTTPGAAQSAKSGASDGFVAKLSADASTFLYLTYLGGNRNDIFNAIALDLDGNVYVGGQTHSGNFPTKSAVQTGIQGNSTGLYRTTSTGTTWSPFDSMLPGTVSSVLVDPDTPGTVLASTEGGVYRTTDNGATWIQRLGNSLTMARSPANRAVVYGTDGFSVFQSTDGGITWLRKGNTPVCCSSGIVADPLDSSAAYVYASGTFGVYRTTDNGTTWASVVTGIPADQNVEKLVTTTNGDLFVALRSAIGGAPSRGVFRSSNKANTWVAASGGLGVDFPLGNMTAANSSVYVTDFFTLYKTTNGGTEWTAIGNLPVSPGCIPSSLAVSPANDSILYFAPCYTGYSTAAMWVSTDGGTTWKPGDGIGVATISLLPTSIIADPTNPGVALAIASVSQVAVLAKLDSSGKSLLSSTYLGDQSQIEGIAVNGDGEVLVTGQTSSLMPITSGALERNREFLTDAFLARIANVASICTYSVTPSQVLPPPWVLFAKYVVTAPSGCPWTASSNQPWAVIASGSSGIGSGVVYVRFAGPTTLTRSATLTIAGQEVIQRQLSGNCGNSISPDSVAIPAGGGQGSFDLRVAAGCEWMAVTDNSTAIEITSPAFGTGNASVAFKVAPNFGTNTRTMSVYSPQGGRITISQAGQVAPAVVATITSTPTGASIIALGDGCIPGTYTTPANLTWNANTNCTVNIRSPQDIGGTQFLFYSASVNGGPASTANPLVVNSGTSPLTISATMLPPCTFSLSSSSQVLTAHGGLGSFTIETGPNCNWTASRSADWITLLRAKGKGTGKVNFAVEANSSAARSGMIVAGGREFAVNQEAFHCTYSITPAAVDFSNAGGNRVVGVTAPSGCSWTAGSNAAWLSVITGASGTGNGSVTLNAQPNASDPRIGTATIAEQTFSASQGAGACGALDVTSSTTVTRSGLNYIYPSSNLFSVTFSVRNNTSTVIPAAQLVLIGLRSSPGAPLVGLLGNQLLTFCFRPEGDYRLLLGNLQPGQTVRVSYIIVTNNVPVPSFSTKVIRGTPTR